MKISANSIVARVGSLVLATAIILTSSYQVTMAADGSNTSTTPYTYVSPENQKLGSSTNTSIRVDIDKNTTNVNDYNAYFWNNWETNKTKTQTATFQGVAFTLTDSNAANNIEPGSAKKLVVSSGKNPRKTMDGVKSAPDDAIYLTISGLSAGTHSIQTIHSSWDEVSPSSIGTVMSVTYATYVPNVPLDFCNDVKTVSCPNFIDNDDKAGTIYLPFNVEAGKDVIISIRAYDPGKSAVLNAFIIDGPDPAKTISKAQPEDGEMHYDESLGLSWQGAATVKSHDVYLGTDFDAVNTGTTSSSTFKGNQTATIYQLKDLSYAEPVYWWRVDEHLASGEVVKGETMAFRPRRLAFPTAEGYGRFATGGRGGRIVEVTNLNDSGEGSLRDALTVQKGPRTVVFRVGGVIPLQSKLTIQGDSGDVYVAGQTAPGDGITITQNTLGAYGAKDIIIRDIRVRVGDVSGQATDGLGLGYCYDSIVDHSSISWSTDEGISSRGSRNITYQKNLIAEPLNDSVHYNDYDQKHLGTMPHPYGATVSGNIGSFYRNLFSNATCRTVSMGGSVESDGKHYAGYIDVTNNVVYNFHYRMADGGVRQVNYVGNYYKMGPDSVRDLPSDPSDPVYLMANDPGDRGYLTYDRSGVLSSLWFTWVNNNHKIGFFQIDGNEMNWPDMQRAYLNGNKEVDINGNTVMGTSMEENWANVGTPKGTNYFTGKPTSLADVRSDVPFFPSYVKTMTADQAYDTVISDVGATRPKQDKYDIRYINEVRNGTYTYIGSKDHMKGYIDTQNDAGGYPTYAETKAPADTDHDGMTDEWEIAHNLNPKDASDGKAYTLSSDGYSNFEVYLNDLAGDYDTPAQDLKINTTGINNGAVGASYSSTMSVSGGSGSYSWTATGLPAGMGINSLTGEVYGAPEAEGNYTIHITVTDSNSAYKSTDLSLTVKPALTINTTELPSGTILNSYSCLINAGGGTSPYSWSATGLPSGMNINSVTGEVYGTPERQGQYVAHITVTDNNLVSSSKDLTLLIYGVGASGTVSSPTTVPSTTPTTTPGTTPSTTPTTTPTTTPGTTPTTTPGADNTPKLNDVKGNWAEESINKMVATGAVSGDPNGDFRPDDNITRAEFVKVLVSALKLDSKDGKVYGDTMNHWAKDYIAIANASGIVSGNTDGEFAPDEFITREQMAVMIAKALKLSYGDSNTTFKDNNEMSDWAKGAIEAAKDKGLIKGYPDGSFMPQGNASRAEAVTIILRALELNK